jgi:hypothetical protein
MSKIERLSRHQRKKIYSNPKAKIAIVLSIILLTMILINDNLDSVIDILPDSLVGSLSEAEFYTLVDSLAYQVDNEFGFNKSIKINDSEISGEYRGAKLYSQPWPRKLPFIFYTKKISGLADKSGLICECVESAKNKQLVCVLKPKRSEFDLRAVIYVSSQRSTKFAEKKIGLILSNIGDLDRADLLKLIEEKVVFSYYADIETFPSGELKRTLQKAGLSSILQFPLDKDLLERFNRPKSGGKNKDLTTDELAQKILDLHPNVAAINLIRTESDAVPFARSIIEKSGKRKIKYIYSDPPPDEIDSLAYSNGLTIVRFDSTAAYYSHDMNLPKVNILSHIINKPNSAEDIVILDVREISVNEIISLSKTLKEIGIKQLQGIRLYQSVEIL